MTDSPLPKALITGKRPPIAKSITFGVVVLGLFFGGFAAWGGLAPLESAAIAIGQVSLDTNRKTVQHLEGGIVRTIKVREGDTVAKDQVLIVLDDTKAKARIALLAAQMEAAKQQLTYIADEIADTETMLKKGLARKPRLLALLRRRSELVGERIKYESELKTAQDIIARAQIRAPLAGTIVDLKVHTLGGVIKAGEPLMSIVPKDEPLVIEARIDPNDIDIVRSGLRAQVRLTPYSVRNVPLMKGRVDWVSADRMSDQRTGTSYYLARITLDNKPSEVASNVTLYPGMPAEVMIVTGSRTMLEYVAAPITRSFRRAFREQ